MARSRRPIIPHQPASTLQYRTPGLLGTNYGAKSFVVATVGDRRWPLYNDHCDPSNLTQSLRGFFNFDYDLNKIFAKSANEITQGIIVHGSDNKNGGSWTTFWCVPEVKKRTEKKPWKGWEQRIEDVYNIVKLLKCGNCGEYASVAFTLLKKQNIRPLDFVVVGTKMGGVYTHNFVVIGRCSKKTGPRKKVIELPEPNLWGNAAVVCDAYNDKVYPAIILNSMRPGDRFRHSLCRLE